MTIAKITSGSKKNYIILLPNANALGFRFFYKDACWKFSSNMYLSILRKSGELIFSFNTYHNRIIGFWVSPNDKFGDWPIYIYDDNNDSSICYETYADTQEIESPEEMLSEKQIAFLKRNSDIYFALEEEE